MARFLDLHAEAAPGLERELRALGRLLDRRSHRPAGADDQLANSHDAGRLVLEELTVDRHVPRALDAAAGQDSLFSDDQTRPLAQLDRARLEQALDLDDRAFAELQRRVAQHVAAAEIAAIGGR